MSTTRRTVLAGIALPSAAGSVLPAALSAAIAADRCPDAALLDTAQRWKRTNEAYEAATAREEALEGIGVPEIPEAVFYRNTDFSLGLAGYPCKLADGRSWYPFEAADAERRGWRRQHWRWEERAVTPEDRLPPDAHCVSYRVARLDTQERVDEIAAAWDGWRAAKAAAQEASGYTAAFAEARRLGKAVREIENTLDAMTPATLAGLAAKAAYVRYLVEREVEVEYLAAILAADILAIAGDAP